MKKEEKATSVKIQEAILKDLQKKFQNKDTPLVVNVQEAHGSHSIILVKNKYLPTQWSLFDPNGLNNFAFTIVDNNYDVTPEYTTVSPKSPLNYGTNAANPGYCGIFGIMFMVFFIENQNKANWLKRWKDLLKIMGDTSLSSQTYSVKKKKVTFPVGIDIAAAIQTIISKGRANQHHKTQERILALLEILESSSKSQIKNYFSKNNSIMPIINEHVLISTVQNLSLSKAKSSSNKPTRPSRT